MTAMLPQEEDIRLLYSALVQNHASFIGQGTLYRALESSLSIRNRDLQRGVIDGLVETGYLDRVDLSDLAQHPQLSAVLYQITEKVLILLS